MKKSAKKSIVQISVFIGVLVVLIVVFLIALKPGAEHKKEWGKIVYFKDVQKDNVNGIQITLNRNGMSFETILNKISNEWYVVSPFQVRADPFVIDKLLSDLVEVSSEQEITNVTPAMFTNYGFELPTSGIILGLNDGKILSILNGRLAPTENYYYSIYNNNSNTVYVTYAYKFSSAEKTPGELANKQLFDDRLQPLVAITNLQLTSDTGVLYSFAQVSNADGLHWEMRSPVRMKADEYSIRRLELQLYAIAANTYAAYDNSPATLKFFQLDKPKYRIRLVTQNGAVSETYIGGLSVSNFVFGYSTVKPGVFQIYESDLAEPFKLAVSNFAIREANR